MAATTLIADLKDMPEDEEFLTPNKMKQFVGISAGMLRQQAKDGMLPHVRIGTLYLFPKKTLLRFLQQRAIEAVKAEDYEYR